MLEVGLDIIARFRRIAASLDQTANRVYFIGAGERIKIGTSKDVHGRVREIQAVNPGPVTLVASAVGGFLEESLLHGHFAKHRAHGEWFEAHADVLSMASALSALGATTVPFDSRRGPRTNKRSVLRDDACLKLELEERLEEALLEVESLRKALVAVGCRPAKRVAPVDLETQAFATPITHAQETLLRFLIACVDSRGRPPTFRETMVHLGWKSTNSVVCHLHALECRGYIARDREVARGVRILRRIA